jgi:heme-degrading monooxygenase HmoA
MVLEIANFSVLPGHEDAFITAYQGARELISVTPGCQSMRMTQGIETPTRFVLLIEWDSVEAHEANFRASERYGPWRAAISPHFAEAPHVEHFDNV